MIDLTQTIIAKSDQTNADDLIGGPRTIKVTKVSLSASPEQPISINYEGDNGKPFLPCKSMRRVLVQIWGSDGNAYIGRSMTIYRDPTVTWGGMEVGGIRISHMSDIKARVTMSLTANKKSKKPYVVDPLVVKDTDSPVSMADLSVLRAEAAKYAELGSEALKKWFTSLPKAHAAEFKGLLEPYKEIAKTHDKPTQTDEDVLG